jgi:hypothetical protein
VRVLNRVENRAAEDAEVSEPDEPDDPGEALQVALDAR